MNSIVQALTKMLSALLDSEKYRVVLAGLKDRDNLWEAAEPNEKTLILITHQDTFSENDIDGASMWLVGRALTEDIRNRVICVAL